MNYNVEVFNIEIKEIICYLGKELDFQDAQQIKKEGKNCFKPYVKVRIMKKGVKK